MTSKIFSQVKNKENGKIGKNYMKTAQNARKVVDV